MIPALARFVDALRAEGLPVSPAEVVDASRALDLVGLERREAVRAALRATLVKNHLRRGAFDALFDRFFAPPERKGEGRGAGRPGGRGERPRPGGPREPQGGRGARPPERPGPPAREGEREPRPREREPRPREGEREPRAGEAFPAVRQPGEKRDGRLRRVLRSHATAGSLGPAGLNLAARLTAEEERRIAREVPRMIREIRTRPGRRLERARTGRPWLRRVLRENLSRGGVPFVIPYRRPKRRAARVVLLVDVSHSVARAAGLFLLMAGAFAELTRRTQVYAFVDRPVDVTGRIARWAARRAAVPAGEPRPAAPRRRERPGAGIAAGGVAFADLLEGISELNLDAPSDYGRAFHALLASRRRPRGRTTVLVVLGDGRTNRFDPTAWALEELARGVRLALWLVPEPRARWGTADSALPVYLPSVDAAAEASDLLGLARAVAVLVRTIA